MKASLDTKRLKANEEHFYLGRGQWGGIQVKWNLGIKEYLCAGVEPGPLNETWMVALYESW